MRSIGVLVAHDHHLPIPQTLLLQTLLIGLREVQSQRLADADHLLILRQLVAVAAPHVENLEHTRNEIKKLSSINYTIL